MHILLTGSTGFLGSRVHTLLEKKHHVYPVRGDLLAPETLRTVPSVDRVVHLAAEVPKAASENTKSLYLHNIHMTENLLNAVPSGGIIVASTIEVYGAPVGTKKLTEHTPTNPQTWYGKSKYMSELLCKKFGHMHDVPVTILRFAGLYGAGDRIHRAIPSFIQSALDGKKIEVTEPNNRRDYLHADDAASATILAAEKNIGGTYCIGTGISLRVLDIAKEIASRINPNVQVTGRPATTRHDLVYSISKAKKHLRFTPRYVFPDRIDEEILWIKNHH